MIIVPFVAPEIFVGMLFGATTPTIVRLVDLIAEKLVVAFDNAVKFIPNEIDTQNSEDSEQAYYTPGMAFDEESQEWRKTDNWNKPSPFGVWGAMGTIASQGEELVLGF